MMMKTLRICKNWFSIPHNPHFHLNRASTGPQSHATPPVSTFVWYLVSGRWSKWCQQYFFQFAHHSQSSLSFPPLFCLLWADPAPRTRQTITTQRSIRLLRWKSWSWKNSGRWKIVGEKVGDGDGARHNRTLASPHNPRQLSSRVVTQKYKNTNTPIKIHKHKYTN